MIDVFGFATKRRAPKLKIRLPLHFKLQNEVAEFSTVSGLILTLVYHFS